MGSHLSSRDRPFPRLESSEPTACFPKYFSLPLTPKMGYMPTEPHRLNDLVLDGRSYSTIQFVSDNKKQGDSWQGKHLSSGEPGRIYESTQPIFYGLVSGANAKLCDISHVVGAMLCKGAWESKVGHLIPMETHMLAKCADCDHFCDCKPSRRTSR